MKNPIKAYANLNQANRRWVTFGAGAVATLVGGPLFITPVAYGAAIADGFHFHKDKKVGARIRAGFVTLVVACAGGALVPDFRKTTAVVTEAPAPVEQVAPVAPTPAPAVVVAPITPDYEYDTAEAAKAEMCTAGRQYLGDVVGGYMTVEQGKNEVRSYSTYLSRNSPASKNDLLMTGMACSGLWK